MVRAERNPRSRLSLTVRQISTIEAERRSIQLCCEKEDAPLTNRTSKETLPPLSCDLSRSILVVGQGLHLLSVDCLARKMVSFSKFNGGAAHNTIDSSSRYYITKVKQHSEQHDANAHIIIWRVAAPLSISDHRYHTTTMYEYLLW